MAMIARAVPDEIGVELAMRPDGSPSGGIELLRFPGAFCDKNKFYINFLAQFSQTPREEGAGLVLDENEAYRIALGVGRLGPARLDGEWPAFSSTFTASSFKNMFQAMSELPMFHEAEEAYHPAQMWQTLMRIRASNLAQLVVRADMVVQLDGAVVGLIEPVGQLAAKFFAYDKYLSPASLVFTDRPPHKAAILAGDAAAVAALFKPGVEASSAIFAEQDDVVVATAVRVFAEQVDFSSVVIEFTNDENDVYSLRRKVKLFYNDESKAIKANLATVLFSFPRLRRLLIASSGASSRNDLADRLIQLFAASGPPANANVFSIASLSGLNARVDQLPESAVANFGAAQTQFFATTDLRADHGGASLLRALLAHPEFILLAKDLELSSHKDIIIHAVGSRFVLLRKVIAQDALEKTLVKHLQTCPLLLAVASNKILIVECLKDIMMADVKLEHPSTPPEVPPELVKQLLESKFSTDLVEFREVVKRFNPLLFKLVDREWVGSNEDILGSPRAATIVSLFERTLSPLFDNLGYEGFTRFMSELAGLMRDMVHGRLFMLRLVAHAFSEGMLDARQEGVLAMSRLNSDATFAAEFGAGRFRFAVSDVHAQDKEAIEHEKHEARKLLQQQGAAPRAPSLAPAPQRVQSINPQLMLAPRPGQPTFTAPARAPLLQKHKTPTPPAPPSKRQGVAGSGAPIPQSQRAPPPPPPAPLPDGAPFVELKQLGNHEILRVGCNYFHEATFAVHLRDGCPVPFMIKSSVGQGLYVDKADWQTFCAACCPCPGKPGHTSLDDTAHRPPTSARVVDLASGRATPPGTGWPNLRTTAREARPQQQRAPVGEPPGFGRRQREH